MNNELIQQKSWWKRNWKWLVPAVGILFISMVLFFSSGLGVITADYTKAYADTQLYEKAFAKVKSDKRVIEILGEIEPIDKFAIMEGSVKYSDDNKTVNSSIRIKGVNGKAMMDITAKLIHNNWDYEKINLRIAKPIEKKQTIEIITTK